MPPAEPRILEIGNYPPPHCGWSTRTKFLVERLRDEGAECEVLDIGPSRKVRRSGCVDVQNGVDYLRKLLRFARRGYRFHVHANGDSPKGFVLVVVALLLGAAFRRRGVLTFHAGVRQKYFPRQSWPWRLFFRLFFGLPVAIVCNSEPVRDAIASYGVPRSKIHAIPAFSRQYVEEEDVDATKLPEKVATVLAEHDPVLCCYAYYRPEFALEGFFRAVRRLSEDRPDLGVILVGGLEGAEPYLSYAEELGIGERIHPVGSLSRDRFLATLDASDLYVRTHLRDGVSSSVLEALALGTPVVAAENESRPDAVRTYPGEDFEELTVTLRDELNRMDADPGTSFAQPEAGDTLGREADLLKRIAEDVLPGSPPSRSAA